MRRGELLFAGNAFRSSSLDLVLSPLWSRRRAFEHAAAKCGDIDAVGVIGVHEDALRVGKWEGVERLPRIPAIGAEMERTLRCALTHCGIDPAGFRRMEIGPEMLAAKPRDSFPCCPAIGRAIQAALLLAACICRADEDDITVFGMHLEVLGPQKPQVFGETTPALPSVFGPIQPNTLAQKSTFSFGRDKGEQCAVLV